MPSNPVDEARCIAETDDDEFLVGQTVYRCQLPDGHDGPHKWSRPYGALIMWEASVVTQARIREEGREQERSRYEGLLREIAAWSMATFPAGTPASHLAHLKREIAELEANPNDPEEWADVAILAVGAVARIGGSLYVEMAAKHQKNLAREWGQPDADGVVEHIRAAARTTSAPADSAPAEKEG
ncbi:MAG: dATP/dGTP pyrophosphohydrolase domain-containing protein [Dehalococcoidia bacterium]